MRMRVGKWVDMKFAGHQLRVACEIETRTCKDAWKCITKLFYFMNYSEYRNPI